MQFRIIEPTPGDLFIIDETKSPVAVGRENSMLGVVAKIGELTGIKIIVEKIHWRLLIPNPF